MGPCGACVTIIARSSKRVNEGGIFPPSRGRAWDMVSCTMENDMMKEEVFMAVRPVFVPGRRDDVEVFMTEFHWNSGMSVSQKRKNIRDLHESFGKRFPERKVLEISSKSEEPLGVALSAFNLQKFVPGRLMNSGVNPTAGGQTLVCGIDNRIAFDFRYVFYNNLKRHG